MKRKYCSGTLLKTIYQKNSTQPKPIRIADKIAISMIQTTKQVTKRQKIITGLRIRGLKILKTTKMLDSRMNLTLTSMID